MKEAVAYYRVSTERQGESGLGLEAQEESVHQFIKLQSIKLLKEFTEIESGKKNKRPVLLEALEYCKKNKTILIIAKLNRLGRNVAFISSLMESRVGFISVDIPEANHFILHILAAVAEYQREEISSTTKSALQAAKRRGVKLGKNGATLALENKKKSLEFANKTKPVIKKIIDEGFITVQAITNQLNKRKIQPFRKSSKWHKSTVHKLLKNAALNQVKKDDF